MFCGIFVNKDVNYNVKLPDIFKIFDLLFKTFISV